MVATVAADQLEGGLVAVEDDDHHRGQGLERLDTDMAEPASRILAITH